MYEYKIALFIVFTLYLILNIKEAFCKSSSGDRFFQTLLWA